MLITMERTTMTDKPPENIKRDVVKTFKESSPISVPKIAKTLGVHKRFVDAVVKELNNEGLVEYSGGRMWKWKQQP